MWELLNSPDFRTNIAAGAVFFVLEGILFVGVLSYVLQRRLDGRWRRARHYLCTSLLRSLHNVTGAFDIQDGHRRQDAERVVTAKVNAFKRDLTDTIQTYGQALNPELMRLGGEVIQSVTLLDYAVEGMFEWGDCENVKLCLRTCLERVEMMFDNIGELEPAKVGIEQVHNEITNIIGEFEQRLGALR